MKTRPLKIRSLFLGAAFLVILGFLTKLYIIGEPVDGAQLSCTTSVNGKTLELQVDSTESAMALRGIRVEQDGSTLRIRARKVLVSPLFFDGSFRTAIDLSGLKTVAIGGKIIWTDESSTP